MVSNLTIRGKGCPLPLVRLGCRPAGIGVAGMVPLAPLMIRNRPIPNERMRPRRDWEISRERLLLPDPPWAQPQTLVSVTAPAGFGKSTLLTQWRRQCQAIGAQVVWLTASGDDRDGSKLLMDFAHALDASLPSARQSLVDGSGHSGHQTLVRALMAELETSGQGAVLFIDDVHELAGSGAEQALELLLRHQPDSLALVLCGRSVIQSAVSQALLEGRLLRYGEPQLALVADEVSTLLEQHGIEPRADLVGRIREQTQGWPAAVRLLCLALQGSPEIEERVIGGLGSSPRALTDYLNDSLFSRMPQPVHDFLLRTAVLRHFDVATARAVSGDDHAAQRLEDVEARGLPIRRSESGDPRYVLHPLVRDYLLTRLSHRSGDELARCRQRALDWLLPAGQVEQAIEVCLDSQDLEGAAALISDHASAMVEQYGRHGTYLYWINKLPDRELRRFPEIRLRQAWSLNFVQRWEEAESIRHALEKDSQAGIGSLDADTCERNVELQRCAENALRDLAEPTLSRTRQWLERWTDASPFQLAVAHTVTGFSEKALGRYAQGLEHARHAQRHAREGRMHYVLAWAHMLAVISLIKRGDCRQALFEVDQGIKELSPKLERRSSAVMMLQAFRAGLLYEFNRLSEVGQALEEGLTVLIEQSSADPMIIAYVTLARLQAAQGNTLEGVETLYEGEVLGRGRKLPRLAIDLAAERVALLLRHGDIAEARRQWTALNQDRSFDGNGGFERTLADKAGRIRARLCLAEDRVSEAAELLHRPIVHARASGQQRKEVELLLLLAIAEHRARHRDAARDAWQKALSLALQGGYLRSFIDEGEDLRLLIEAYGAGDNDKGAMGSLVAQLSDALRPVAPSGAGTKTDQLLEALTERELQIVTRLSAGPSNRQLSDALCITPGTLKWHLSNIYSKLGVTNRLAAIARAQELRLIDPSR